MKQEYYTVSEASRLCKLHPRTVVRKIKDGTLTAHKIGRQYRVSRQDLEAFMGGSLGGRQESSAPARPHKGILVSSVVDLDDVDQQDSQRISNTLMAALSSERSSSSRVDCLYYEDQKKLKVIIHSDLERASQILKILETIFDQF